MTEREQFEAWAKDSGLWTDKWNTAQDEYLSHGTTWAWNAWQARATPASTFGTELSARIDSMLNKVFICANDEQQKTFNRMIVLLADCKAALTASATPALPQGKPVAYQYRMRASWSDLWTNWEYCSKGSFDDYKRVPINGDWHYEARALYEHPEALPQGVEEWIKQNKFSALSAGEFNDVVSIRDLRA